LISSWTEEVDFRADLMKGEQTFECRFKRIAIRPGRQVAVELWMSDGAVLDHVESARILDVIEAEPCGFSVRADQGSVLCDYEWSRLS
jgi:lipopolysaccharide transport system ATP-binding protein